MIITFCISITTRHTLSATFVLEWMQDGGHDEIGKDSVGDCLDVPVWWGVRTERTWGCDWRGGGGGGGLDLFNRQTSAALNISLVSHARFITPLTARDRRRRCWRHRGLRPRKQAVRIMFILLVLAGDVELNSGPIHPSEHRPCYRYPCTICAKPVRFPPLY